MYIVQFIVILFGIVHFAQCAAMMSEEEGMVRKTFLNNINNTSYLVSLIPKLWKMVKYIRDV